ncbi:P-loop containing nucleoside triphosphate hydrolase protein [Melanogaster broomeanus]|nr:P-loop containing nucleoside triphosphate hydrolase protein [Melanogaster broomeanus]
MDAAVQRSQFASKDGRELCRRILDKLMPYDTHEYQLDAITHLLDQKDVLFVTATGTGKTDTFIRLMHVVRMLSENPSMHDEAARFPRDPVMLIVCPTKALELDMERKMRHAKLNAVAVNADTVDDARKKGINIFNTIQAGVTMVLLSPEQLKSRGFWNVLEAKDFCQRITMMAIDEAHLLNSWGKALRPAYNQIGWLRARIATHPVLLVTTATLEKGEPTKRVCECLGLTNGTYHFIRRSNIRGDIRLVFRNMQSGLSRFRFEELKWTLYVDGGTVIFCRTIAVGFRVAVYLYGEGKKDLSCNKRVRMYNSLNWASYNSATLAFLNDDPTAQIIIATDTLSVGFDSPHIKRVVIFGEPMDTDDYLQKVGRIRISTLPANLNGSDASQRQLLMLQPSAITYLTPSAIGNAEDIIVGQPKTGKKSGHGSKGPQMSANMARLILAPCKVKELDSTSQ